MARFKGDAYLELDVGEDLMSEESTPFEVKRMSSQEGERLLLQTELGKALVKTMIIEMAEAVLSRSKTVFGQV